MEIRPASESDISQIVSLLKISLGETLLPKSEAYWRWKHIDNPFGKSPVYVAEENGRIIGVRAFMRWEWRYRGSVFQAVRAVDTATHPEHQGKGIFKKLTLKLAEACKADGVSFIFNTPNDQSRPGYVKMGWEIAGKFPVSVNVRSVFSGIANRLRGAKLSEQDVQRPDFLHQIKKPSQYYQSNDSDFVTHTSPEYFSWRYLKVPILNYGGLKLDDTDDFLIYRLKSNRAGIELRICDIFADSEDGYQRLIHTLYRRHEMQFATCSGKSGRLPGLLSFRLNIGPVVTVKNLNLSSLVDLKGFKHWSPSLGDLELF